MIRIFILFFIFLKLTLLASPISTKVSLQLNWKHQFEFAGIYAAIEQGFYKDVNLELELKEFDNSIDIISDVKNNITTFGIYDLSLLKYYDPKKPIVLLANYFKKSALVLIVKQDIFTPYDLKDKTILANEIQLENSILYSMLEKFEIRKKDFKKIVPHDFKVDKFISGEVDAMTAYITNELYYVKKANVGFNILDPSNYGSSGYSENLFSSKEFASNNPLLTKNFIDATNKGWKYALANKKEIVDLIYNKYSKLKGKEALLDEAKEVDKLIMKNVYALGSLDKKNIEKMLSNRKFKAFVKDGLNIDDLIFSYNNKINNSILTKKEQEYLNNKKEIKVCIDPNWMPYEKLENGKYFGMSKDYMDILEKKINIPINLYPTKNWSKSLKSIEERKCDILSLAVETKERKRFLNFTSAYLRAPLVITTKINERFITNISEVIATKKIAVVKNYAVTSVLKRSYSSNKIIEVSNMEEGFTKILSGEVFAFVGSLSAIGYRIQNDYLGELKIAGKLDESLNLSLGVRNDDLMLLHILDKMLLSIDEKTKQHIINNWINVKFEKGFDYSAFWKVIIVFILLGFIFLYRHRLLLKRNKEIKEQQIKLEKKNKKLEETSKKLEDTLEGFQVLLNSTMEAVFVFENGYCLDVNESGMKLFGYEEKEELLGKHIKEFVEKEEINKIADNSTHDTSPYETSLVKKDGTIFPAYVQGRNAVLNGKKIRISTALDISELKYQEKLLLQQSKMASLGEMIGNIAHQWRQPLSLISTVATGLSLRIEVDTFNKKDALEDLAKLNDATQHLSKTIDDFRNFFSMNKQSVTFNVKDLLTKNFNLLENILKISEISIIINCEDNLELTTYKNELLQVLLNILNNSCDALKNIKENRVIYIDVTSKKNFLVIKIKDNGLGIDENIIHKIFEPYFTTKHQSSGTGIGLYMSHQIINKHIKGKISAKNTKFIYKNKEHFGALFIIEVPLS